tara:strand:- start:93 stop:1277 length:1185 start_codon:yes stop_codon:yes gene_type:complete
MTTKIKSMADFKKLTGFDLEELDMDNEIPSVYLIYDFFKLLKDKYLDKYDDLKKINLENKLFTQDMLTQLPKNLQELHIPNRSIVNPEYDFFNPDKSHQEKSNNYSISIRNEEDNTTYSFDDEDEDSEEEDNYIEVVREDTYFLDLYDILPKSLKLLNLYHNELRYIEAFPPNLEELLLHKNIFLQRIPKLPDSIQLLSLTWTHLKEMPNIPQNIRYLSIRGAKIEELDLGKFPDCFEKLYASQSGLKKLYTSTGKFPKKLMIVDILECDRLKDIPEFPETVFVLKDLISDKLEIQEKVKAKLKEKMEENAKLEAATNDKIEEGECIIAEVEAKAKLESGVEDKTDSFKLEKMRKYKLADLKKIALDMGIDIKNGSKNKKMAELYKEIEEKVNQ